MDSHQDAPAAPDTFEATDGGGGGGGGIEGRPSHDDITQPLPPGRNKTCAIFLYIPFGYVLSCDTYCVSMPTSFLTDLLLLYHVCRNRRRHRGKSISASFQVAPVERLNSVLVRYEEMQMCASSARLPRFYQIDLPAVWSAHEIDAGGTFPMLEIINVATKG